MPDSTLPGDVRATIGRRVELLADDTRRMLAAASVFGRRFDVAPLAMAIKLEPDVVIAALREAVAAEVVTDDGDGHYTFAHALIEDTLYDSLTPTRRARLHRAAADALEQLSPDDPPLAAIAYHSCRALPAGDRTRAVDYARRAGADAATRGASEQAVQHFERAREAAAGGDAGTLGAVEWGALLCDLGDAYDHAGQTEAAQATYAEAVDLATLCNDTIGLARSVLGLMGGVDETVGFNLTGTDGALVAMLDDIRIRLPEDEIALRALVTARVAGARYDAGEVERAQELSSEALDLARGRATRTRSRSQWPCGTPRCRARRRSTTACASTRSCARWGGLSRCRPRCGGSGTCSSVAGSRTRIARWRRWRRRRSPAHCHARRITSRSTGQCARRSTVTSTKRRAAARKPARSDNRSVRVGPGSATPCNRCSSHANAVSWTGSSRCSTRSPPSTRTNRAS